ncbi:hypothetical protein GEMRC1_011185 [Eukaryota sp. GEM-RC1]
MARKTLFRLVQRLYPVLFAAKHIPPLNNVWVALFSLITATHLISTSLLTPELRDNIGSAADFLEVVQSPVSGFNPNQASEFILIQQLFWTSLVICITVLTFLLVFGRKNSAKAPFPFLYVFSHLFPQFSSFLLVPILHLFLFFTRCQHLIPEGFEPSLQQCVTFPSVVPFLASIVGIILLLVLSFLSSILHFTFEYSSTTLTARNSSIAFNLFITMVFTSSLMDAFLPSLSSQKLFILIVLCYHGVKRTVLFQPFYSTILNDFVSGIFAFSFGQFTLAFIYSFFSVSFSPIVQYSLFSLFIVGFVFSFLQRNKLLRVGDIVKHVVKAEMKGRLESPRHDDDVMSVGSTMAQNDYVSDSGSMISSIPSEMSFKKIRSVKFLSPDHVELNLRFIRHSHRASLKERHSLYKKRDSILSKLLPLPPGLHKNLETQNNGVDPAEDPRMKICTEIIRFGLEQFTESPTLALKAAFIYTIYQQNPTLAFSYLQRAKRTLETSIPLSFQFFCGIRTREEAVSLHGVQEDSGDAVVEFNKMFRTARRRTIDTQRTISNFWKILLDDVPDTDALLAQMRRISAVKQRTEKAYASLLTKFPSNSQALRSYATYLSDIQKDEGQAKAYLVKADEIEESHSKSRTSQEFSDQGTGTDITAGSTLSLAMTFDQDEVSSTERRSIRVRKQSWMTLGFLSLVLISVFIYVLFSSTHLSGFVTLISESSRSMDNTVRSALFARRSALSMTGKDLDVYGSLNSTVEYLPNFENFVSHSYELFKTTNSLRERSAGSFFFANTQLGKSVWKEQLDFADFRVSEGFNKTSRALFLFDAINQYVLSLLVILNAPDSTTFAFDHPRQSRHLLVVFSNYEQICEFLSESISEIIDFFFSQETLFLLS